jgi:hypothetical protein
MSHKNTREQFVDTASLNPGEKHNFHSDAQPRRNSRTLVKPTEPVELDDSELGHFTSRGRAIELGHFTSRPNARNLCTPPIHTTHEPSKARRVLA